MTGKVFTKIEKTKSGLVGTYSDGETIAADQIMVATGRAPNTAGIGLRPRALHSASAARSRSMRHSRSNVPSIYAIGDVTDRVNLTPVAIREGHAFADSLFGKRAWTVDHDLIPTGVFSTPEIGTVGLPEHEAAKRMEGSTSTRRGSRR